MARQRPEGLAWCKSAPARRSMMAKLDRMQPGDMPDVRARHANDLQRASSKCPASVKHMIIISDGDPSPPGTTLVGMLQEGQNQD